MINQKGFTLIELLVVVAIIGMLSSTVLTTLGSARVRARDAKRLSDLKQIQTALEFYYEDNRGEYPDGDQLESALANWSTLATALEPYINPLPVDPVNVSGGPWIRYVYDSDSGDNHQTYGLGASFESPSNNDLMTEDGGHYIWVYEVGEQPAYCHSKVTPDDWWGGGANVCVGGN